MRKDKEIEANLNTPFGIAGKATQLKNAPGTMADQTYNITVSEPRKRRVYKRREMGPNS